MRNYKSIRQIIALLLISAVLLSSCSVSSSKTHKGSITIRYNTDYDDGIAKVDWNSSWFDESPYEFNRDLAQTCAAVAAASNDTGDHTGEAQYIVPAVKDALGFKDVCLYNYSKYSGSGASLRKSDSDDCAITIGHQKMKTDNGSFELVIIVCRGTETLSESFFNDFIQTLSESKDGRWSPHKSYEGYINYADQVFDARLDYYNNHKSVFEDNDVRYLIIGHSLGGAAAQLVAARLEDWDQCVFAYTFGALNASNEPATEYGNIFNIFNYYDTYGPHGSYLPALKPTKGADTWDNKFGKVLVFQKDYAKILTKKPSLYTDHVMASYYHAMEDGMLDSFDPNYSSDSSDSSSDTGSFEFVGTKWKQEYGAGTWEWYDGRTITFHKDGHCSLWSPYDTYEIKNVTSNGFDLSIVGLIGGNPVYHVKIIDNDTIELYLSTHQFTLTRVK